MAAENGQDAVNSAPTRTPFFDELPRELRNEIYRLAFIEGNSRDFKIISRINWMDAERKSRRGLAEGVHYSRRGTSKTFLTPPLQNMHVCRQFETEAVEEWFRHHMISCPDLEKWQDLCTRDPRLQKNTVSLRCRWGSHDRFGLFRPNTTGSWPGFSALRDCDKLKNLELMVHDGIFNVFTDRIACLHDYDDVDFESLEEVPVLRSMKALESIVLVPADVERSRRLAKTPAEVEKWEDNVKSLEVYLNKIIRKSTAPTPEPATDSSPLSQSGIVRATAQSLLGQVLMITRKLLNT